MTWARFRQGKLYDLLAGAPLILWFGWNALAARPNLILLGRLLLIAPGPLAALRFLAVLAAILFDLLLVWSILARGPVVRRAPGWLARLCGVAGTFFSVGILQLPFVTLPPLWQGVATLFLLAGGLGSFLVLLRLGRSFSIVPEARALVTDGPYRHARHPLYAMELLTLIGMGLQYRQPWAALIVLAAVALLLARSHYEEQVLAAAYPDYAAYRARVKRFGFV